MRLLNGALVIALAVGGCGAHCDERCRSFKHEPVTVTQVPAGHANDRVLVVTGAWRSTQPGGDLAISPSRTLVGFVGLGPALRTKTMHCARADAAGGVVLPAREQTVVHLRDAGPNGPAEDLLLVPMCSEEAPGESWSADIVHADWSTFKNDPIHGFCVKTRAHDLPDLEIEYLR